MRRLSIFYVILLILVGLILVSGQKRIIKPAKKTTKKPTGKPKTAKGPYDSSALPSERAGIVSRDGCAPPEVLVNGTALPDGSGGGNGRTEFATVNEVQFLGILGPEEQKRICKIKCLNGVWVGPFCTIDEGDDTLQAVLKRCTIRITDAELVGRTLDGRVLPSDTEVSFPHDSEILLKCVEPGMYKFVGNSSIVCDDGDWSSELPHCEATTIQRNFSADAAPTILYHVVSGDAGLAEDGAVVVFPGSIINFDCLYPRPYGDPVWTWTPTHRQYPSAWAIKAEERNSKYRLSVYYAKIHDSGTYTCTTPHGTTNDISMEVKDVHCPALQSVDHNRVMAVEGNKMHSKARFACMEGYILAGPEEIACQASGQWSEAAPHCEIVQCPPLVPDTIHLQMSTNNRTYGTRVLFSCTMGFKLAGPPFSTCLKTGNWSDRLPTCDPISCKRPDTPKNGRVLSMDRFLSGDFVQYECNAHFALVGESVSICNDNGVWTQPVPKCKPICEFPGHPSNGQVLPTKFQYDVNEAVVVTCNQGYKLIGKNPLRCATNGLWSSPIPRCTIVPKAIDRITAK